MSQRDRWMLAAFFRVSAAFFWALAATAAASILYGVWTAANGEPAGWFVAGLLLPLPVVEGFVASMLTREARAAL